MSGRRILHMSAWVVAIVLVTLPLVAVNQGWFASERWPFRNLRISGEFSQVQADQVSAATAPVLGKGFFAVDLKTVRERVELLPWVEAAEVRKHWPDLLEIRILEHHAVATWGERQLINTNGNLFEVPATHATSGLPHLIGPAGLHTQVWKFYTEAKEHLADTGLVPAGIVLSNRGAWTVPLLDGGVLILGHQDAGSRLAHFAEVFHEVSHTDKHRLVHADLRYSNGFALRWQPLAENDIPLLEAPTNVEPGSESPAPAKTTELSTEAANT